MRTKPLAVWNTPEEWEKVSAQAVASGSAAQMANVLEMALQDLLAVHDAVRFEFEPWLEKRDLTAPIRFRKSTTTV